MSFENPLSKMPAKKPEAANDHFEYGQPVQLTREELEAGGDPYRDSQGRVTPVSADGFLNRNFGKTYRAEGEAATQAESAAIESADGHVSENPTMPEELSIEEIEQQIAEQEVVQEVRSAQSEQVSVERGPRAEKQELEKPYFTQLIDYFTAGGFEDPEAEALDELKSSIDPNITDPRQRGEVAASFLREHREYQDKQDS